MQISIDVEILENIFTHANGAARIARHIENAVVGGALTKSINEIVGMVAGLLGKSYAPQLAGELMQDDESEFNFATAVGDLCQLVAKADAMANAATSLLDEMLCGNDDSDRRLLERLAHLVGATFEAVQAAMVSGDMLAVEHSTRRIEKYGAD